MVWKSKYNQEGGLLNQLHERGVSYLIYPAGSLGWDEELGLTEQSQTYSTVEEDWEKHFSFEHFLDFEIQDSLVLALADKNTGVLDALVKTLSGELKYYGGKFQGVLLRSDLERLPSGLDLSGLKTKLNKMGMKLGISLSFKSLGHGSTVFLKTPDFYVFQVRGAQAFHQDSLVRKVSIAAGLNRPFFLDFQMRSEIYLSGHGTPVKHPELFIEKANLSLEAESFMGFEQSQVFRLNQDLIWDERAYPQGTRVKMREPTLKGMHKFLNLASTLEPYWYCGVMVNPGSWSARIMLSDTLEIAHPRVYYQVRQNHDEIELSLELENPNPVASSAGKGDAGIALRLSGFQLGSMNLGDFDGLRATPSSRGQELFITKDRLGAFEKAGPIILKLKANSPKSSIHSLGWLRPRSEEQNYYDSGFSSSRVPEFQFAQESRLIWEKGKAEVEPGGGGSPPQ